MTAKICRLDLATKSKSSKRSSATVDAVAFDLQWTGAAAAVCAAAPNTVHSLAASLLEREALRICYQFEPGRQPGGRIRIAIDTPCQMRNGLDAADLLRRLIRACFPGFEPKIADDAPRMVRTPLRPPIVDPKSLAVSPAPSLAPQERLAGEERSIAMVLRSRAATVRSLAGTLQLLHRLQLPCGLVIEARRFRLKANDERALQAVRGSIATAITYGEITAQRMQAAEWALELMRHWLMNPVGLTWTYSLESDVELDHRLAHVVQSCLFDGVDGGPRGEVGIDLSNAYALAGAPPPVLVDGASLARIGFLRGDQRPPAGRAGLLLGENWAGKPVAVPRSDLSRHLYTIGATGVGKSMLMASMIQQDISEGLPFVLVDPHGDLFEDVMAQLPNCVKERALVADVSDFDAPFSINPLEVFGDHLAIRRNFAVNQLMNMFKQVLYPNVPDAFGPVWASYTRNGLLLVMDAEGPSASLLSFERVFSDAAYRRNLLERCADQTVVRFWRGIAQKAGGDLTLENVAPYICSKLNEFTGNALIRPIISQPTSTLNFDKALAEKRCVLVNLAKGVVGGPDAALLGALVTIKLFSAAMARSAQPRRARTPVRVYLDEFQTFASGVLAEMLAECRKFGLELTLANQSLDQVEGRGADIAHAVLANVGSIIAFRVGPNDAHRLANWFEPDFGRADLQNLPDRTFVGRLLNQGRPSRPTIAKTLTLATSPDPYHHQE